MHQNEKSIWTEFEHEADYSPVAYIKNGKKENLNCHPDVPKPYRVIKELDGWNMAGGPIDGSYGPLINLKNVDGNKLDGHTVLKDKVKISDI